MLRAATGYRQLAMKRKERDANLEQGLVEMRAPHVKLVVHRNPCFVLAVMELILELIDASVAVDGIA